MGISLGRIKYTAIIKSILGSHFYKILSGAIRGSHSLIIDESTTGGTIEKQLGWYEHKHLI